VTTAPAPPTTAAATTCSSSGSGRPNVPSWGSSPGLGRRRMPTSSAGSDALNVCPRRQGVRLALRVFVSRNIRAHRGSRLTIAVDTCPRWPKNAGNPAANSAIEPVP
jgi:hypothetical protein